MIPSNGKYEAAIKAAWRYIGGGGLPRVFPECRRGIQGAKIIGRGCMGLDVNQPLFISGLRGEFHVMNMPDGKKPGFFVRKIRVDGEWLEAMKILKQRRLPTIYI